MDEEVFLYVYDQSKTLIGVIDRFISLIWADRYDECGDFELLIPYNESYKSILVKDNYCSVDYSDHWCIIEKIECSKDDDGIAQMLVSGRSLESIPERRIVSHKTDFGKVDEQPEPIELESGDDEEESERRILLQNEELSDEEEEPEEANVQESILQLFTEHLIEPEDEKRKIEDFIFEKSSDEAVKKLTFKESYNGEDLYNVTTKVCSDKHIGFKIVVNELNQFVFSLYKGKDRTLPDSADEYVLFSPYYDNLKNSKYFSSKEPYRNVMIVSKSEDEFITVTNLETEPSGLERREVHEDSSGLKENESNELTDDQIIAKGKKKLNFDYKEETGFEGDVIPDAVYKYREDYNVGDKVHFEDEYGNYEDVYISEVVISYDENGLSIIPTFKAIDWNEEDE